MPAYIPFLRVSTKHQENARQLADITAAAAQHHWPLAEPVQEVVSGAKRNAERPGLAELLKRARKGDTVVTTEISRLGRDTQQVLTFIKELSERGICVYVLNHNLATLRPDGRPDQMAQAMLTFGAEFARLERVTLRERVQSGVDQAKQKGVTLGRPTGTTKSALAAHPDVAALLRKGRSVREVAKLTDKSHTTVAKVRKALVLQEWSEAPE